METTVTVLPGQDPAIAAKAAEMGVAYEVAYQATIVEKFLSERSGKSVLDIAPLVEGAQEYDDFCQTTLQVVVQKPAMEVVSVQQPGGEVQKVKQQKVNPETGLPVMKNSRDVAIVALASPAEVGLSWADVQAAALDMLTAVVTGTIYQGMKKKGYAFRQGEAILFKDVMSFFDAKSLPELTATLLPKFVPKLSESDKQKAAQAACALGSDDQTSELTNWMGDKAFANLLYTATQGKPDSWNKRKQDGLNKVVTFLLDFITTGKMKGSKPSIEQWQTVHKLTIATAVRLKRNHDKLEAVRRNSPDTLTERDAETIAKLNVAYRAFEHMKCSADQLNHQLLAIAAKAALKAADKIAKDNPAAAETVMNEADLY